MIPLLLYSMFCATTHPDPPFHLCDDTSNLAVNSRYRASLDNLLSSMSSPLASRFYTTTKGRDDSSDKVYGLFLCYAYSSLDDCQKCVLPQALPQTVAKMCPYKYEATVWEENCLFRYSTRNFFGHLNATGNILLDNRKNVTDPQRFRSLVNETLHSLSLSAASHPPSAMHSNGSTPFTNGSTLYAFVQCFNDLSPTDCRACLGSAIQEILDCYYFSRGGRVLGRSCFLRYELYNFIAGESSAAGKSIRLLLSIH